MEASVARIRFLSVVGSTMAVALVAACSGAAPSSAFGEKLAPGPQPGGGSAGADAGSESPGPSLGGDFADAGGSQPGPSVTACATATAAAQGLPVYLVFMFDRSGSMKFNPSPNNKWDACVSGLDSFFADPGSGGIHASIQVFPYKTNECASSTYETPIVDVTALPDGTNALKNALAANGPQPSYGTPTLPALRGAIAHAQAVQAGLKNGEKVAVVLVTDGDPNDCNSTPQNVAAAAAAVAATIPTYVIGVGPETTKLDQIATGGGTAPAIIVSTSDPSTITADFEKAIAAIKSKALSCEYKVPAPPTGQQLDVNSVNVQFTPKAGAPVTLSYNKDCSAAGEGWRYDDPSSPTKIQICKATCDTVKADLGAKLDIVIGCRTQGAGPGGVAK